MPVDAVIPALDEEQTVAAVVRAVRSCPLVRSVIVVDDGSRDKTAAEAEGAGAVVVRRARSGGKGDAVRDGARVSDADVLLLLDADLLRLTDAHIRLLLQPVLDGRTDMNVGLRDYGKLKAFVSRLPLVSGQRALTRAAFERVPAHLLRGYGLEAALNAACRARGLRTTVVHLPGLVVRRKFEKVGPLRSVFAYARMWAQVVAASVRARRYFAR